MQSKVRNKIGIASASVLLSVLCVAHHSALADDSVSWMVRAQKLYAAGDATGSMRILDPLLKTNPADATAHYLKANCLVLLKRNAEAFNEYTLAERLAPKSAIASYCHTARVNLDQLLRQQTGGDEAGTGGSRAAPTPGMAGGGGGGVRGAGTNGSSELPPGTLELIRKQAELAKDRAVETGKAEAANEVLKADNQARSAQERAARQSAEMAAANGRGGSEPTVTSPTELPEPLRSQAAANAERLKQLGKMKAEMKEQESQEKADEIERQAQGLQDQLLHRHRSTNQEIELNPVGTNLYIRNYSNVPATVTPLHAQAGSIVKKDSTATKSTSASVSSTGIAAGLKTKASAANNSTKDSGQGALDKHAVTSVKGQVLPLKPR
jgi:hypothetical protein